LQPRQAGRIADAMVQPLVAPRLCSVCSIMAALESECVMLERITAADRSVKRFLVEDL